ncbi:MAG: hypothetical protein A2504_05330 [Bdellovibrionales bacterium RIFOXYD12_FULL_39_22]|nr:MAG: hypothetical protein A2385_06495 [Bdellovibrionales bacterium RIFOXYB1_FULL_39_21]OFZ41927.1 MAG: hypothetical protein A2485_08465 [Bdellovibrionales bacterium RIFOXYC12_FULL_39_17]OFZ50643.1 MAG: hypothetical protein A2404_05415 [Bdellovibrionales bacterium RIFOXYC1_FULL_39_130]OFZ71411.1 MAG: hypothetical protein A2451_15105 [Bdellovibrionales bacterium RIFOXYC2_FULL_39_8]OFZ77866.1 MAG: hypothetical protein A2560_00585 [Bdellovibrionales bacterium RIFOXYD1_FULL_39_84]OFZ93698.1 MAG:
MIKLRGNFFIFLLMMSGAAMAETYVCSGAIRANQYKIYLYNCADRNFSFGIVSSSSKYGEVHVASENTKIEADFDISYSATQTDRRDVTYIKIAVNDMGGSRPGDSINGSLDISYIRDEHRESDNVSLVCKRGNDPIPTTDSCLRR